MAQPAPLAIGTRQPEAVVAWMESLADATRLRLLRVLEGHALGVAELVDILQMPQSTVSRHLKVLADQGWVTSRAQGPANLYRMTEDADSARRRLWQWTRDQMGDWATTHHDTLRRERLLARREPSGPAFFAGAASRWDRLREAVYGRSFTEAALAALLPPTWVVADLGCGTGAVTAALAPHARRVIGVDLNAAMLRTARRRTASFGNVELRRGRLEELPIEDGACDAALLLLVLAYVDDPAAVVREMARVLRPGGRAVVVDLLRHDDDDFRRDMGQRRRGIAPEELTALFKGAGLAGMRCRPLAPDSAAKGPALLLGAAERRGKRSRDRERKRNPKGETTR